MSDDCSDSKPKMKVGNFVTTRTASTSDAYASAATMTGSEKIKFFKTELRQSHQKLCLLLVNNSIFQ